MTLIENVCRYKSVSVVGMAKNTGKTEGLNYVLAGCQRCGHRVGVTSIGLDGETCDSVTGTAKPEIHLSEGVLFATAEKLYARRRLTAEIMAVEDWQTALGRLVTAKVVVPGKVMLSGPVSTGRLLEVIRQLQERGAETVLVDGALSRKSLASPAVTEAMILSTGAALSPNIPELVRKTRFVYQLIQLPQAQLSDRQIFEQTETGIFAIDDDGNAIDLEIPSALLLENDKQKLFAHGHRLFVSGMVSDKLLNMLRMQPEIGSAELIVKDFTRIFATAEAVRAYLQKGGQLTVLHKPNLLAVTVNPWSPTGYVLDSLRLREALAEVIDVPVVDVREN